MLVRFESEQHSPPSPETRLRAVMHALICDAFHSDGDGHAMFPHWLRREWKWLGRRSVHSVCAVLRFSESHGLRKGVREKDPETRREALKLANHMLMMAREEI